MDEEKRRGRVKEFYTILTFSQNNKCNNQNESGAWEEGRKRTGNKRRKKKKKSHVQQNSNLTLSFAKPEKENLDDVYYAGQGL